MTLRTGKGGRYRYYTCSIKARQGETGCSGRSIRCRNSTPSSATILRTGCSSERLEIPGLDPRSTRGAGGSAQEHIAELNRRAAETELRLKRLYEAIEAGVADLNDPALKERVVALRALRDQAQVDSERAQAMLESSGSMAVTPAALRKFATTAGVGSGRRAAATGGSSARIAQRVEVGEGHVRIMGSKGELLRAVTSVSSGKSAGSACPRWD
jgi:hypothetical protein